MRQKSQYQSDTLSAHLEKRDPVTEFLIAPRCQVCGKSMERLVFSSGAVEARTVWKRRKTCSSGEGRKQSRCRKKLGATISFRGKTRYCECGKKLRYQTLKRNPTGLCYPCYVKTGVYKQRRPEGKIIRPRYNRWLPTPDTTE